MLKNFRKIKTSHYVILILFFTIFLCSEMCTSRHDADGNTLIFDSYGQAFAGTASCMSCHKEIYNSQTHTAHYLDSRPASKQTIKGSFDSSRNRFVYNRSFDVLLQQKSNGFYETAFRDGKEYRSEPIDIVIGSGRKGQTYLYSGDDGKLFQLPVSYSTLTDSWCNSPGYSPDSPSFNRPIPAYCLECHTTYARTVFHNNRDPGDFFDMNQIIYGIGCERCHGPGAAHVAYHTAHPGESIGKYIINTGRLSRQQQLDACALCHSGSRFPLRPAFAFKTGDKLNDFSETKYIVDSSANLDVHGNQYGLLTASKCFKQSQMECSTCHNVHITQVASPKLFSQRCMSCHTEATHNTCTMPPTPGLVLGDNCIDCHMPALATKKIVLQLSNASDSGRSISTLVRTHRIAIYAQQTKEYLDKLKLRAAPHS